MVDAGDDECGQVGCTKQWDKYEVVCTKYQDVYTCGTKYASDTYTGCGSRIFYCCSESSTFTDPNDSFSWYASLEEVGGYAKKQVISFL